MTHQFIFLCFCTISLVYGHDIIDPVKPGKCPEVSLSSERCLPRACRDDSNCPGVEKCCPSNCGHVCQKPVEPSTKVGNCPSTPQIYGLCAIQCKNDYDCEGRLKCCLHGKGKSCQDPVKPGVCPKPFGIDVEKACRKICEGDYDCPRLQKCCGDGCNAVCVDPIGRKPLTCPALAIYGPCIELCDCDENCPGSQKCCSNGCGHVCL